MWPTPEDAATGTTAVVIRIPNHKAARAHLRGLLLDSVNPDNWSNEYGITPESAAAEWEQALQDALEMTTCDDI